VRNSIRNIQGTTRENLKRTEEAVDAVREGTRLVEASGAALGDIVSISMHMGEQIRSIATLSQEHERAHDAINDAVEEVRGIANATESGMRHSGGVVRDLSRSSSELLQLIARLRG
jgi:methyl-accepting chemotaxis protein